MVALDLTPELFATAIRRAEQYHGEILANVERRNEATDGSLLMYAEYLVAIGRKRP
ncbi:MAG TPA: hypothetical protein VNA28_13330 [Solirubrobacteraceae bacterium]|nr:hypothetical protein [Solirubrobacteraceae bacterium]